MKKVIMQRFDFVNQAEDFANEQAEKGYRLISFSNYKDMCGVVFVVCMELSNLDRVGGLE